jgi:hypothetical protein
MADSGAKNGPPHHSLSLNASVMREIHLSGKSVNQDVQCSAPSQTLEHHVKASLPITK